MVRRQRRALSGAALLVAAALAAPVAAQPLPERGEQAHEGVASCATSVCHGKVAPAEDSTVWLNEYRVWLRQDYHSRAYRTLQTEQSKSIARKLGLPAAHTAKICLDCHADNVPADARGAKFQISDGVGCEGCHGGAGQWLESHAEAGTSHEDNIAKGMYPTEQPAARAQLCLSCHLGTAEKFASHDIMGAGHPRLAFELETFTVNQPAHYTVDQDYRERKVTVESTNMWLAGLVYGGEQSLALLQGPRFQTAGLIPELSFYQCHACHHPMDELRWQPEGGPGALPPGTVRLNDGNLLVLIAVLESLDAASAATLESGLGGLHSASLVSRDAVASAAAELMGELQRLEGSLTERRYDADTLARLRMQLLALAEGGRFRHFTAAEQLFLAVETLTIELGDEKRLKSLLDALFESVGDENRFIPEQFAVDAGRLGDAL